MKSERRHELQHNALADWMAQTGKELKPYQNLIWSVVVIGLVTFAAYTWWSRTSASQAAKAWGEFNDGMETGDLTELTQVIESYPDTKVAHTATVLSGDYRLISGCDRLFENKAIGEQQLSKAIILYESDRRQSKSSMLLERATFGLARAKEAKGVLEEAERYYREVVANWPNGAYAAVANQRLDELKRPEIKRLYDDFRNFDPVPAFSNEFDVPGQRPGFDMKDVPKEKPTEFPDLDLNLDKEENGEQKK